MADIIRTQGESLPSSMRTRYKDMGDGTHALVAAADVAGSGSIPVVYNLTLTLANTEYSQTMPTGCRFLEFQCRTENDIRYSNVAGKVAGSVAPYMTLKAGDYYYSPSFNVGSSPVIVYFASSTAAVVVEIIGWS